MTSMQIQINQDGQCTPIHPFSLTKPRYDGSTFIGRLRTNLDVVDPRTLFVTKKQVMEHVNLLESFRKNGYACGATDKELWYSLKVKNSAVHPDTGDVIYRPFRMSGFVPYGTPLVLAMLVPAATNSMPIMALAQTLNQSHNAAVNWCNRSATKDGDGSTKDILRGYFSAVGAALTFSLSSMMFLSRLRPSPRNEMLKLFVPWPAVMAASTSNMVMMRYGELTKGVMMKDAETGEELGMSQKAAKMAIQSTAVARATLATAACLGPQLCYLAADKFGMFRRLPRARLPAQALFTLGCFGLGVPLSLSFFTQDIEVDASQVESKFQGMKRSDGAPVQRLRFNKGL